MRPWKEREYMWLTLWWLIAEKPQGPVTSMSLWARHEDVFAALRLKEEAVTAVSVHMYSWCDSAHTCPGVFIPGTSLLPCAQARVEAPGLFRASWC